MSEYAECTTCKYVNEKADGEHCKYCTLNACRFTLNYKPMTNADRIRNMSDADLADMLHNIGSYVEDGEPLIDIFVGEEKTTMSDDFGSIIEWLQAEVKEGAEDERN